MNAEDGREIQCTTCEKQCEVQLGTARAPPATGTNFLESVDSKIAESGKEMKK